MDKDLMTVIKTIPESNPEKKKFIETSDIFKTEMEMYTEVLPDILELWRSTGDDSMLCPRYVKN